MMKFSAEIEKIRTILKYQKDPEIRIRGRMLLDIMLSKNVSHGCKKSGIAPRTFYFWLNRVRQSGFASNGLKAKSRAPHRSPNIKSSKIIDLAVKVRADTGISGKAVATILRRDHGIYIAGSTVCKHFRKRGISRIYRKINKNSHNKRYSCENPLDRVQSDTCWLGIEDDNGNRIFTVPVIDDCSRAVSVHVCDAIGGDESVAALNKFIEKYGRPVVVQTDNGVEFTAKYNSRLNSLRDKEPRYSPFEIECQSLGIRHSLIKPRTPQLNGKVERFNQTLQRGLNVLSLNGLPFKEIVRRVENYVVWYNSKRPHSSLNYLTPHEKFKKSPPDKVA